MTYILTTLTVATATSCHNDDYGSCAELTGVAELKAVYDYQWEYSYLYPYDTPIDWESLWPTLGFSRSYQELKPGLPEGLRTIVYVDEDAVDVRNIPPRGGLVYIMGDRPSMLVFNNDTEYNVIIDADEEDEISVSTRRMERPGFVPSVYAQDAVTLTTPPDVMYHCFIPQIYRNNYSDTLQITAPMIPLVFTYAIRYGFDYGLDYVAVARGALAGMSRGARLWDGEPMEHRVSVGYEAEITDNGVEAYVNSFGHPIEADDETFGLLLEVRLKNGKILTYDFDITQQMRFQPCGGVIMVGGIEIPDSIGEQPKGGGFDVTIEGWGEFEDIPIDI